LRQKMATRTTTTSPSSGPPQVGNAESNNGTTSRKDWVLLSQGAEARVWKAPNHFTNPTSTSSNSSWMIIKERFAKSYRHQILDERLTKQRCRAEGRLLETCHQHCTKLIKKNKHSNRVTWWSVPAVLRIDPPLLYLEYLSDYSTVREYLDRMLPRLETNNDNAHRDKNDAKQHHYFTDDQDRLLELANTMGIVIAQLHNLKMVHGDLTTSNMMIMKNDQDNHPLKLFLIDFGLAKHTESAEERAVDLYVLERALLATHPRLGEPLGGLVAAKDNQTNKKQKKNDGNDETNEDETDPDHDDHDDEEECGIKDEEREEPEEEEESDNFLTCLWNAYEREAQKAKVTMNRLYQVRQRGRKRECFG